MGLYHCWHRYGWGGPVGLRLAEHGFSVLFIERGGSPFDHTALCGQFAEQFSSEDNVLARAGRSDQMIYEQRGTRFCPLLPLLGSGVGGSSSLFGAVMSRFSEADLAAWPTSYSEFETYYEAAEKLFRVNQRERLRHPANQQLFRSGLINA